MVAEVVAEVAEVGNVLLMNMDYNQWKKEVMSELSKRGFSHLQPDEDALYMAFDMEFKTVLEVVEELIANQQEG